MNRSIPSGPHGCVVVRSRLVRASSWLLVASLYLVCGTPSEAALSTDNPTGFFTNIASRLLQSDAAVAATWPYSAALPPCPTSLNSIQVYPTNQYTPAVHRVLQVAANLYDAATNRYYGTTNAFPTIFRPLFLTTHTNGTQVFTVGYEELTNHSGLITAPPPMRGFDDTNNLQVDTYDLVMGIPLVIGAKMWPTVSTNTPLNGVFDYLEDPSLAAPARFFRSVVLP